MFNQSVIRFKSKDKFVSTPDSSVHGVEILCQCLPKPQNRLVVKEVNLADKVTVIRSFPTSKMRQMKHVNKDILTDLGAN